MQLDILTLFPDMFVGPFAVSIVKRAQQHSLVSIQLHNFRSFAEDKHQSVDDTPYGGGAGMLLKVDVLVKALETILGRSLPSQREGEKIVLLSAKGTSLTQARVRQLAKLDRLVLIAGHYAGVDDRIDHFIDETISIGNYVLSGGEIPAMVVTDAIVRLLPGVITEQSPLEESFSTARTMEYPQYTRPTSFRGLVVPDVLRSGNHTAITQWRKEHQKKR